LWFHLYQTKQNYDQTTTHNLLQKQTPFRCYKLGASLVICEDEGGVLWQGLCDSHPLIGIVTRLTHYINSMIHLVGPVHTKLVNTFFLLKWYF
jgi:hypothetical protein